MPSSRQGLLVLAFVSCMPLACKDGGCGAGSQATPPSTSASAAVSASGAVSASASAGRHRGALRVGGVAAPLFRAANGLELRSEQKPAYEKIGTSMRDAARNDADAGIGARGAFKETNSVLAAGVRAGKIDTAKLDALQTTTDKAARARQDREADALNQLHAALDAGQRAKVVEVVRGDEEKRAARMKGRDAGAGPNFARLRLEWYTRDLALDPDQLKKVEALLPKDDASTATAREEGRKWLESILAGFATDGFDAKKLAPDPKKAIRPMDDVSKFLGQVVPILKPPQREALAAKLEKANEDHPKIRRLPGPGRHDPRVPDTQEDDDDSE